MAAEIKLVKHIGSYFLIQTRERCVYDQWWDEFGQAAQGFIERQHPYLPLPRRGVRFLPSSLLAVATHEPTLPMAVEIHPAKFTLPLGNLDPQLPDFLRNLAAHLN